MSVTMLILAPIVRTCLKTRSGNPKFNQNRARHVWVLRVVMGTSGVGARPPFADLRMSHRAVWQMAMVLTALKGMVSVMAGAACCQRTPKDQSKAGGMP